MNFEFLYQPTLILHIAAGFTSLLTGILALLVKKGSKLHKRLGLVFFWSMMIIAGTAIAIAIPKQQTFLLMIAIFSFFQAYFGYRAIRNKQFTYNILDLIVLSIATLNTISMLFSMKIVLMVFGSISAILVWGQARLFYLAYRQKPIAKMTWLRQHIGMMMGAMIGSITAFVLVNLRNFQPAWLPWLLPTAVLVPLIVYFQRKYAKT
jgi:uncharacterized membrane protein